MVNIAGQSSEGYFYQTVTVDTTIATPVIIVQETGKSSTDNITMNTTLLVSNIEEGAMWEYSLDGGTSWTTGTSSNSFKAASDTTYDAGKIQVRQTDVAGNTATGMNATKIVFDNSILTPFLEFEEDTARLGGTNDDGVTKNGKVILSNLDPDLDYWEYTIDGGDTWIGGEGNSFVLPQGTYTDYDLLVRVVNIAGQSSEGYFYETVTVDTTIPDVAIDPIVDSTSPITGTAEGNSVVIVNVIVNGVKGSDQYVSADPAGNWSISIPGLMPGQSVSAVSVDQAGNRSIVATETVPDATPSASFASKQYVDNVASDTGTDGATAKSNDATPNSSLADDSGTSSSENSSDVASTPSTFNGSSADEVFQGNAGSDTYNMGTTGGSDTIYFALLNASHDTGGNGIDQANNFKIGKIGTDANADVIDIHELFNDKISNVLHTDSTGKVTLDPSSNLTEYVNVTYDGTNTHVQIDRDGKAGTTHTFTDVLILNDVKTDLLTLIQNNQLII